MVKDSGDFGALTTGDFKLLVCLIKHIKGSLDVSACSSANMGIGS